MENYEELEGKRIIYKDGIEDIDAKVSIIEKGIGITIVDANNPENYLACLIMPKSPKWMKEWKGLENTTNKAFDLYIQGIKNGVVDSKAHIDLWNEEENVDSGATYLDEESCAF